MPDRQMWDEASAPYEMLKTIRETSWIYGRIYRDLAAIKTLTGANDMRIAATALTHKLPIATGNIQKLQRVQNLEVIAV